ncbi:MAG TPA: hypothetical protein VLW52_08990 [Opitutaceae bacterium]|nr:hypothetical protein [Opitutaceae bacterium]
MTTSDFNSRQPDRLRLWAYVLIALAALLTGVILGILSGPTLGGPRGGGPPPAVNPRSLNP